MSLEVMIGRKERISSSPSTTPLFIPLPEHPPVHRDDAIVPSRIGRHEPFVRPGRPRSMAMLWAEARRYRQRGTASDDSRSRL